MTTRAARPVRVAIVGGGIAGLAAAHHLATTAPDVDVELFEATTQLGGKLGEVVIDGIVVPTAADAFLARRPEMRRLADDLGLESELVSPKATEARIFRDGELHRLPTTVLGIPTDLDELRSGRLISADGVRRAEADLTADDDRPDGDESVGALVRRRLGDEVLEYLVDPLLGGINAGDSDRLSVEAGAPQIGDLRARHSSLVTAARSMRPTKLPDESPVFLTTRGGLSRLVDELVEQLASAGGVAVHRERPIDTIRPDSDDNWIIGGTSFGAVVVATPAGSTAELVEPVSPTAARMLRQIDYSSVALALLVCPEGSIPLDPAVSGVLVPRNEKLNITALSVATNKWPDMAPDGRQVLRVSVGRRHDTRWQGMDDEALLHTVLGDLRTVLGQPVEPTATEVVRWPHSLPQYDVGHGQLIDRVDEALADVAAGLLLAGGALRGLGLPACVGSGRLAADRALERVRFGRRI